MSFLSTLNISGSGMTAQRLRLDVVAENIANIETTRTESGGPYRRKTVTLEAEGSSFQSVFNQALAGRADTEEAGVRVASVQEDASEGKLVYDPTHPDADEDGYVEMPNVDLIKETADAMAASQAYQANITAFNTAKLMAEKALQVGR